MPLTAVDIATLLIPSNEQGLYVRTQVFQSVLDTLSRSFHALIGEADMHIRSPGFIAREHLDRSSYVDRFPQFVARVTPELETPHAGSGGLMALPSACLCLYPMMRTRPIPAQGYMAKVLAPCFRNEAFYGPERMRAFTMSEYVFFGRPDQTGPFRDRMIALIMDWLGGLGLGGRLITASDPFYGRLGEMLAIKQRADDLKLELFLPVSEDEEIACFSFNDHSDFFASRWDIEAEEGGEVHSACVGVGLERLSLALFNRYGLDGRLWPADVCALLARSGG